MKCGALGELRVGGRVVGTVRCELDEGHAEGPFPRQLERPEPLPGGGWTGIWRFQMSATPHRFSLVWEDGTEPVLDDPDVPTVDVPVSKWGSWETLHPDDPRLDEQG